MYYLLYVITTIFVGVVAGLLGNFISYLFGYKEDGFFSGTVLILIIVIYSTVVQIFQSYESLLYFLVGSILILWMVLSYDKNKDRE